MTDSASKHPGQEILRRFVKQQLEQKEWEDVKQHLMECDDCAVEYAMIEAMSRAASDDVWLIRYLRA
jgi:anti-sigma factor RsiW